MSEFEALTPFERFAFRLVRRMNQGAWKRFWTWCQSTFGAGWIHLSTYNIMNVYGLEHVEAASRDRPFLLVANHRSFFDMYAVSTVLFYQDELAQATFFSRARQIFLPVAARVVRQLDHGLVVHVSAVLRYWRSSDSGETRISINFRLRVLADLARSGPGNIIGFHPEGTRNKSDDPYSFLRAQPGVGKLIMEAQPQVIPVFIAGLCNSLPKQVARNWNREEVIRIHFGPLLDLSEHLAKPDRLRTHKEIADAVMEKIAELGEEDRSIHRLHGLKDESVQSV